MKTLIYINRDDRHWTRNRFVLCFGAYGETKLVVWADHLHDALDDAIDWMVENAPGLLCDDEVSEAYQEAIEEGKSEEEAHEIACEDTTQGGNCGNYILSHEWGVLSENPSKDQLREICGGNA